MQVRNSAIGKIVMKSDQAPSLPSINELSQLNFTHATSKANFSYKDIPEMIASKHVISSPPPTEFKVQDYPLKRMQKGLSGWDWQTETSEEFDLRDRVFNCKPGHSTFSKLFPTRNPDLYNSKKPDRSLAQSSLSLSPPPVKEFNRRLDKMSEYRESMLKAQQVFKLH
jgi:hypothetical protein